MAPPVRTIIIVARAGSRVVRYLIRPARATDHRIQGEMQQFGRDPWLRRPSRLAQGGGLARRGAGLAVLLVLSVLGTLLLGSLGFGLLILLGLGSHLAGWLLGFTLLLGLIGALWTARRASLLLQAPEELAQGGSGTPDGELALLKLLRTHERALPAPLEPAFQSAVITTRDALRLTATDTTLHRDTYDVRQAARQDLPELLDAYHAVPPSRESNQQLLEQLRLIEERMQAVVVERSAQKQRVLSANGEYLRGKYLDEEAE